MNKTLKITLIILGILILIAGGYFLYQKGYQSGTESKSTVSPSPSLTVSSPKASAILSPSPSISPSPTSSAEKTVKDVHCLQNPAKDATIQVSNPQDYSTLPSNFTFSGTANVFEGQFQYRLKDCRGPVLSEGSVLVNGEAGSDSPYSQNVSIDLSRSPMDVILEVFEVSMADGSEVNLTQVPLRLTN